MDTVTSSDGTAIAFDRLGEGPAVIMIGRGPTDRSANAPLAELLAKRFTVVNYDRRGRGDSGDTAPYAVEREVEDLQALIADAGYAVFAAAPRAGALQALAAEHPGVRPVVLDVTDAASIDRVRQGQARSVSRGSSCVRL